MGIQGHPGIGGEVEGEVRGSRSRSAQQARVATAGRGKRSHPLGFVASLALLAALLASALVLAPSAEARIYWTTSSGNIGRSNLDGTGIRGRFIRSAAVYPNAVAIYGRHIYWVDINRDTIGRANLNGTGVNRNFMRFPDSAAFRPHDIAVGAGHIYWATDGTFIGRARLNGTHRQPRLIGVGRRFSPGSLAVNARHIYWTGSAFEEPSVIGRANLNGTGVRNTFIRSRTSPSSIAVGGGHIYWTTPRNTIVRANLNGTGVRPRFITMPNGQPGNIEAGAGHIYWTNWNYFKHPVEGKEGFGWISRANLNGTGLRTRFLVRTGGNPTDVAATSDARPRGRG